MHLEEVIPFTAEKETYIIAVYCKILWMKIYPTNQWNSLKNVKMIVQTSKSITLKWLSRFELSFIFSQH